MDWTSIKWGDPNSFPKHSQTVLAIDMFGNIQVCWHDAITRDFMLCTNGLEPQFNNKRDPDSGLREYLIGFVFEFFLRVEKHLSPKERKKWDELLNEEYYETIGQDVGEAIYFDEVVAWCALPDYADAAFCGEINDEALAFKAYAVMDEIEPVIRKAIMQACNRNGPYAIQADTL